MINNLTNRFHYQPQRSCGQGNIFTPVCHSFCSQGGCLPQCMLGYHTPAGADTPPEQTPLDQTPQEQTPHWEQTPPGTRHPHPPRNRHKPGTRHPPGPDTDPQGTKYTPRDLVHPQGLSTLPGLSTPTPGSRLRHMVNERPVRILLECILVFEY